MNRTIAKIKHINSSPLFLISVLAFTVGTGVFFVCSTTLPSAIYNTVIASISQAPLKQAIDKNLIPAINALPFTLLAYGLLFLLICIGMWMHFFANRTKGDSVSTLGLTLIKVVAIFQAVSFVICYLLTGLILGLTVLAIMEALKEMGLSLVLVPLIIIAVLYILIFVLVIFYYRGILRSIKSVRMTLSTGVIMGKISVYVIVINYIIAICLLVSAVLSPSLIWLVAGILFAISLVFTSLSMSGLRREMLHIADRGGESPD